MPSSGSCFDGDREPDSEVTGVWAVALSGDDSSGTVDLNSDSISLIWLSGACGDDKAEVAGEIESTPLESRVIGNEFCETALCSWDAADAIVSEVASGSNIETVNILFGRASHATKIDKTMRNLKRNLAQVKFKSQVATVIYLIIIEVGSRTGVSVMTNDLRLEHWQLKSHLYSPDRLSRDTNN